MWVWAFTCMDKHTPLQTFTELFALGFCPMPVIWDIEKRIVSKYPEHQTDITDGRVTLQDVERWLNNGFKNFNGVALKVYPPYGMIDFDVKNTTNKNLYKDWLEIINATNPEILRKVCIETTKSEGFHVYIKYHKLDHKIPIARNPVGSETISIYTGGLLSFCYPSPGYQLIHNSFEDVQELTDDEFQLLVNTGAIFNECPDFKVGQNKVALVNYPTEYENICIQFDTQLTNEGFETLLNSINLFRTDNHLFKNKLWSAFLRKGSNASYSAKAYFNKNKRLLIFSASMVDFPTWHDSERSGDNTWSLSPSKIVYYKNKKDWINTIEEIKFIAESIGLELAEQQPVTHQTIQDESRLKFPYDIFPESIQNYISFQVIQHEYLAASILAALSAAIGNTVVLEAMEGFMIKPILYMAIVAPPGASKTPAMRKSFEPLENYDSKLYEQYKSSLENYKLELALYEKDKKKTDKPDKPNFPQTLIKDSTIEMVIKILSHNDKGCCIFADELSGFIKRMNQYKDGDEVQKWLELWSGSPILLQRISRDENKVQEPFCSIVGGIQPGVLDYLSKEENQHNGFFHRFLFVYPKPDRKAGWQKMEVPALVKHRYKCTIEDILKHRDNLDKTVYLLSNEANALFKDWFDYKNDKYNKATNDNTKGIIAKYQEYCLRFALLIQVTHDEYYRGNIVSVNNMERAIRLTEYFLGNMAKAIKILSPETPVDKLQPPYDNFYSSLPDNFTLKTALEIGKNIGIKAPTVKTFLYRTAKNLFNQLEKGKYEKVY